MYGGETPPIIDFRTHEVSGELDALSYRVLIIARD
jgi:hypothetical protein